VKQPQWLGPVSDFAGACYTTRIYIVQYEWDAAENLRNHRTHGVSFELAARVFEDDLCQIVADRIDPATGEMRWHAIGAVRNEFGIVAVLLVVHVYRENIMAKRLSASFRPARLKSMSSEDIGSRKLTDREGQAIRRIAAQQATGDDSRIGLKAIPRLTDQQLAAIVRLRDVRPRKKAVSVRLDERVLDWLKSKGRGHLTLINDTLANMMEAEQRAGRSR
jgi:uncharacterized DUF497 family protein/uncharacterized protein (DUF4415 family)